MNLTSHQWVAVSLFLLVVLAAVSLPVSAQQGGYTRGEPELTAYAPDNEVVPGSETTVGIQLQNDGQVDVGTQTDTVTTARGVSVEVRDSGPFEIRGGTIPLGSIADGMSTTANLRVGTPSDLEPGSYEVSLNVRYSHTQSISPNNNRVNDRSRLQRVTVTLTVTEDPRFEITNVTTDLQPGMSGTSIVELTNIGATDATDVRATLRGNSGLTFGDGTVDASISDLDAGDSTRINVSTTLSERTEDGAIPITASVQYTDEDGIDREAPSADGTFMTQPAASFSVIADDSALAVGERGELSGTVRNDGTSTVTDGVLIVESTGESLQVTDPRFALPPLEPGERTDYSFETTVSPNTDGGAQQARFAVEYANGGATTIRSDPIASRVSIADAASFRIENLSDTLAVGYSGTIAGELRNDGERTVTDGVLVIEPTSDSISIEERRFALPPVEPGEAVPFEYQTDIGGSVDAGPRQVRFTVEYNNDRAEPTQVGPLAHRVEIDPQRREFSVNGTETRVAAGGSTELVLEITNERPETLENINAKVFADSPLSVDSEEAFVKRLEPGDSAKLVFSISAEEDTMAKTYPVEMDFQYETERGESVLSDTYQQPVSVTEPTDDGDRSPIVTGAIVLLVLGLLGGLAFAGYRYRQRTT